jgi:molybdopterin/thiamine biosynthesis adenylyltransferase
MSSSPEIDIIHDLIEQETRLGALEVKGAWSKGASVVGARLLTAISRSVTHGMNWLGAEFAIAAVSDALMPVGDITGALQVGNPLGAFPRRALPHGCGLVATWSHLRTRDPRESAGLSSRGRTTPSRSVSLGGGSNRAGLDPQSGQSTAHLGRRRTRTTRGVCAFFARTRRCRSSTDSPSNVNNSTEIIPPLSKPLLNEGSRWIYYPWRRAVVRLLAPKSFSTLRLDRNRNKLTRAEQARQRTLRIGVVGLSAGHTIAHVIAMEGLAGEIRLADFDTLELSNLNRIPASVLDLGVNKAIVAARRIAEIDPYLRVVVEPTGVRPENLGEFLDGLDLVIEECDSLDMKFLVREAARERQIPVIMETSDRGVLDVERFDLEPDRPIFHGLLGDMDSSKLANLTTAQKGPYVIRLIGAREASSRGAASLLEVGQTITGWPQLGSEITLGAATVAAAVRRIGLAGDLPSGRVRFDVEEILERTRAGGGQPRSRSRPLHPAARGPAARQRRPDRDDRRRRASGTVGRQRAAVALRGRRRRDPILHDPRANVHDGRGLSRYLRGYRRGPLQCPSPGGSR